MKKEIAIVPGSFDPISNGHIYIIKKAAESYKKVYVAVMINANKKYMFDIKKRKAIAKAALENISNVTVIASEGWLWQLANELNADAIVKGYRNETDLQYELEMAKFNKEHAPNTETVILKADPSLTDISSTLIRKYIQEGISLTGLLPDKAIEEITKTSSDL